MKEKERGGMRQKKKEGVKKKKVPMRESNPRPLNLQTKSVAIVSPRMRIYDQTSRIYIIYIANLECHDLNVSALAALAPPIIGGASAASEATLSSCQSRFAIYVGIVRACNQCLLSVVKAGSMIYHDKNYHINLVTLALFSFPKVTLGYDVDCCAHTTC